MSSSATAPRPSSCIVLARAQSVLVAGTTIELSLPRESIVITAIGSSL
jgi:hypothetical protein